MTAWRTVHVFVCSTFSDMHAERDYLVKRVFPELHDWCAERRLWLNDVDLRWGITEADLEKQDAVDICLSAVDSARPFFVGFLGQRFGTVVTADDLLQATRDRYPGIGEFAGDASITALEIRHALRPFGRVGRGAPAVSDALFYFRDDSYLKAIPVTPVQLQSCYTDDALNTSTALRQHHRLEALKAEIAASGCQVRRYTAVWRDDERHHTPEIALPMASPSSKADQIERWREEWWRHAGLRLTGSAILEGTPEWFAARAYLEELTRGRLTGFHCPGALLTRGGSLAAVLVRDLRQAIARRFPNRTTVSSTDQLQLELDQQEEYLFAQSRAFVPRQGDFDALDRHCDADGEGRLLQLIGQPGSGKSCLLAKWTSDRLSAASGPGTPLLLFRGIGAGEQSTTVDGLLRSLSLEMKRQGALTAEIPDDPGALRDAWPSLLEAAAAQRSLIIVLDGLDQLAIDPADTSWIPESPPANARLIVSSQRPWGSTGRSVVTTVAPFGTADRRALVTGYLAEYLKRPSDDLREQIVNHPGSANPLFLKVVLSELRLFGDYRGLHDLIRGNLGETPASSFDWLLTRLEADAGYTPLDQRRIVPLLFGALAAARTGLTRQDLVDLTCHYYDSASASDGSAGRVDRALAADAINVCLRHIRPFVARRGQRMDFFYDSFKAAAARRYHEIRADSGPAAASAVEWHRRLADLFSRRAAGGWQSAAPRDLSEFLFHQLEGRLFGAQAELLFEPRFRDACIAVNGPAFFVSSVSRLLQTLNDDPDEDARAVLRLIRLSIPPDDYYLRFMPDLASGLRGNPAEVAHFLDGCLSMPGHEPHAAIGLLALAADEDAGHNCRDSEVQKALSALTPRLLASRDRRTRWEAIHAYWALRPSGAAADLLAVAESPTEHPLIRAEAARQLAVTDDVHVLSRLEALTRTGIFPLELMARFAVNSIELSAGLRSPERPDEALVGSIPQDGAADCLRNLGATCDDLTGLARPGGRLLVHLITPSTLAVEVRWNTIERLLALLVGLKCRLVCTESGSGDDNLADLHRLANSERQLRTAVRYMHRLQLHAADFLQITTSLDFDYYGVEHLPSWDAGSRQKAARAGWGIGLAHVASVARARHLLGTTLEVMAVGGSDTAVLITSELAAFQIARLLGEEKQYFQQSALAAGLPPSDSPGPSGVLLKRALPAVPAHMVGKPANLTYVMIAVRDPVGGLFDTDINYIHAGTSRSGRQPGENVAGAITSRVTAAIGRRSASAPLWYPPAAADADFSGLDLSRQSYAGKALGRIDLSRAVLVETNLSDVTMRGALLRRANLSRASLARADCEGAALFRATLTGVVADTANLRRVNAYETRFDEASLRGAFLSDSTCFAATFDGADLSGADLRRVDFRHASFCRADLTGAQVDEAHFDGARYDGKTRWPAGFEPRTRGAMFIARPLTTRIESPKAAQALRPVNDAVRRLCSGDQTGGMRQLEEVIAFWTASLSTNPDALDQCLTAVVNALHDQGQTEVASAIASRVGLAARSARE